MDDRALGPIEKQIFDLFHVFQGQTMGVSLKLFDSLAHKDSLDGWMQSMKGL